MKKTKFTKVNLINLPKWKHHLAQSLLKTYGGDIKRTVNTEITQAVSTTSRITIWRVCLVTRDINHMDCHKPYQPYGLLQLHKPYSTRKQVYAHAQRLGLQSARSAHRGKLSRTLWHSHYLALTYTSLHKAKRTNRARDFHKRCCRW